MPPIPDPLLNDAPTQDVSREEEMRRYMDAFARGMTGSKLARAAGLPVPQGTSPATVSPPPGPILNVNYEKRAQPVYAPGEMGPFFDQLETQVRDLPLAQAQAAVNAATQYQAMRGYMRDIENGQDKREAFAKWGPLLWAKPGAGTGLSGVASVMRAQRTPDWRFQEGGENAPSAFVDVGAGSRPVVVPRTALPEATGPLQKEEIAPGIFAVRSPGSRGLHIVKSDNQPLSIRDRAMLMTKIPQMQSRLSTMDETSAEYRDAVDLIRQARALASPPSAPVAMPRGVQAVPGPGRVSMPTVATNRPAGATNAPVSATNAPPVVTSAADRAKLVPGTVYIYKGKRYRAK